MPLKNITKFCTAKSKRTGLPCKNPPVGTCKTCRYHGGWKKDARKAPTGEAHWNYKDGSLTKEAIANHRETITRLRLLEDLARHLKMIPDSAPRTRGAKPSSYQYFNYNDPEQLCQAIFIIGKPK